jgi:hypothetical protein
MNKLKYLIGALLLVIASCSQNGTPDPIKEINKPLLKSIDEVNPSSGLSTTFTYDGFKIKDATTIGINVGQFKINYIYNGDLIAQEDGYINDILYVSNEYIYENNKLKTVIFKNTNSGTIFPPINDTKLIYNYISDNLVDIDHYSYSNNNWEPSQYITKTKIYLSGDNIIKREKLKSDGTIISTLNYEYDNNPNIYKNITGFNKLFFKDSFTNNFNRHFNIQDISNANNVTHYESERYKYNTNVNGYPIEKLLYYSSSQYLIEKKYTYY